MKWVKTLIIGDNERVENRLARILNYIQENYSPIECYVSGVDATGAKGGAMTDLTNDNHERQVPLQDILEIASEGQIIEIDLSIKSTTNFDITIQDGYVVEVSGDGFGLPDSILGDHTDGNLTE